jgi:hypothetical protein
MTKTLLLASVIVLALLAASAQAGAPRVLSPYALSRGDALDMQIDVPSASASGICTSLIVGLYGPDRTCWGRAVRGRSGSWAITRGGSPLGLLSRTVVFGLGPKGSTRALVHLAGATYVVRERGPYRAFALLRGQSGDTPPAVWVTFG